MKKSFLLRSALVALVAVFAAPFYCLAQDDKQEFDQVLDVVYKKVGDREIKLNLYRPVDQDGKVVAGTPLLIWLDSGCWYSDKPGNGGLWRMMDALKKDFAIASVSHRPITEAPFPAPIEDVRAAVRFLRKHAADYGYDPNRIAVSGASSGGHLSLMLGVSDEKSIFDVGDNLDVSGQPQAVIEFFGPADFEVVFERFAAQALDCIYLANASPREAADPNSPDHAALMENAKKFSPITYVDEHFAPTLILQGADDPIVPLSQSALMYEALKIAGVRTQMIVADGGVHDPSSLGSRIFLSREIFEFLGW